MSVQDLNQLNIFDILGSEGSPEEKEEFLNLMEQAIVEEMVDTEFADNLSDEEVTQIGQIFDNEDQLSAEEMREQIIELLSSSRPNIDDLLIEYTNKAKQQLLYERIEGLKEFYKADQAGLAKLDEAYQLYQAKDYIQAVAVLNDLVDYQTQS